ncbi:MAG TPA: hypothetical protein DEP91_06625 [Sphingomonas bacterium]|uniref:Uncharacterized protein n=1 Tax=Sphingomonas bacterium TaxID=1895847 RepID=A0A3D0WCX6_9SPHN|nr:hypothetical protein [Sphingomonas bacterium]
MPLAAQTRGDSRGRLNPDVEAPLQQQPLRSAPSTIPGRAADAGNGTIGQRQTREQVTPNVEPLARIENRIANRVQNRIRNRVDRFYDPQQNTATPFRTADEQVRTAGTRPRR